MTTPATGPISMSDLNIELGRAANTTISLNDTAVRGLAGVASGSVGFSSLRGKSAWTVSLFPPSRSDSGTASFKNFIVECNGAPAGSTFVWSFGDDRIGVWSFQGGQGTDTVTIRGSSAIDSDIYTTLRCTVTYGGVTKFVEGLWEYSSYGINP